MQVASFLHFLLVNLKRDLSDLFMVGKYDLSCRRLGHAHIKITLPKCNSTKLGWFCSYWERMFETEDSRSQNIEVRLLLHFLAMPHCQICFFMVPQLLRWKADPSCMKTRRQDLQEYSIHMRLRLVSTLACTTRATLRVTFGNHLLSEPAIAQLQRSMNRGLLKTSRT